MKDNHNVCSGKNSIKKSCEYLREHTMKKINFEKKKIIPLTNEIYQSYLHQRDFNISKKSSKINALMIKNVVEHCHYTDKYGGAVFGIKH